MGRVSGVRVVLDGWVLTGRCRDDEKVGMGIVVEEDGGPTLCGVGSLVVFAD